MALAQSGTSGGLRSNAGGALDGLASDPEEDRPLDDIEGTGESDEDGEDGGEGDGDGLDKAGIVSKVIDKLKREKGGGGSGNDGKAEDSEAGGIEKVNGGRRKKSITATMRACGSRTQSTRSCNERHTAQQV